MRHLFKSDSVFLQNIQWIAILILLLINTDTAAKIYKWVDEKGKVHYTDKPHSDQDQTIKIPNTPKQSAVDEANNRAKAIIDHQNKVSQINQEMAQSQKQLELKSNQDKKHLTKQCHSARKNVIALGHGRPTYIKGKGKKNHFLSDKEKNKKIDELQKFISKNCRLQLTN
ncbi:MAG: DUF4124 domain-containing protein [Enterobacterales bacterium]|nr:DUF4124 domain-containing protein [Enterobacterales bacterium]